MARCFLAINLSSEATGEILAAMDKWKFLGRHVRWIRPENIHLTMKFLGDISTSKTREVAETMKAICSNTTPFSINLASTGVFPNLRRPRILWVGLDGDIHELSNFRDSIETGLKACGIDQDRKPFIPHVTVARIKGRPPSKEKLSQFIRSRLAPAATRCTAIHFYSSRLTPSGPVYSLRGVFPFERKHGTAFQVSGTSSEKD